MSPKKAKLTAEERRERGRQAVSVRWENKRKREASQEAPTSFNIEEPPTVPAPLPEPPAPILAAPKRPKKSRMVKEFGVAHSYAEKRLAEAIKERAHAMGKVAMLNAEIPSLVGIIKALGNTPDLSGMHEFAAQIPGNYVPPSMTQGLDPAMPPIPVARGGGMGVIDTAPPTNEDMFLSGDAMTSGGGWR